MKKFLLLLVVALLGFANSSWAEEILTAYELTFSSKKNQSKTSAYDNCSFNVLIDDLSWTLINFNNNNNGKGEFPKNSDEWTYVKCGGKSSTSGTLKEFIATIFTNFSSDYPISQINVKGSKGVASATLDLTLNIYQDENKETLVDSKTLSNVSFSNDEIVINLDKKEIGYYYELVFKVGNTTTSNGAIIVNSVSYNYSPNVISQVATPTITANGMEIKNDDEIPAGTVITIDCLTEGAKLTGFISFIADEDANIDLDEEAVPYKFTVKEEDIVTIEVVADAEGMITSEEANVIFEVIPSTGPMTFIPQFKEIETLVLDPEKEVTAEIELTNEGNMPVINYSITEGESIIDLNGTTITALAVGKANVSASWDESEEWFGGYAEIPVVVKSQLTNDTFGFQYSIVRGKKNVGVLSQAVHYAGTGTVTYNVYNYEDEETKTNLIPTPEDEITIDHNNGMMRTDDIKNAVINKEYTVIASVEENDEHLAAQASYIFIIEEPESPETELGDIDHTIVEKYFGNNEFKPNYETTEYWSKALPTSYNDNETIHKSLNTRIEYTFKNIMYTQYSNYFFIQFNKESGKKGYISFEIPENCISVILKGGKETSSQVNTTITVSKDNSFDSETFNYSEQNKVNNEYIYTYSIPKEYINRKGESSKSIMKIEANSYAYRLASITFNIAKENEVENTLQEAGLHFDISDPDDNYYFNCFEDETVKLPPLMHNEALIIDDLTLELDPFNEDDDDAVQSCEIINKSFDALEISIPNPGTYTFRAKYVAPDEGAKCLSGMAILRLNVFPRLPILPSESDDTSLADDERTLNPALTLVNSIKSDEGEDIATISLPNIADLENDFKYSTINVTKVEIKHGDKIFRYIDSANAPANVKARAAAEENNIVEKNISELPTEFRFSEDGSITYGLTYASTSQFYNETTVHVVFMPDWTFETGKNEKGDVTATATATNNSELLYRYFVYNPTNPEIPTLSQNNKQNVKSKVVAEGWQTAENGTHTFSREDSNNLVIPNGQKLGVSFVSVKDITSTGLDLEDPLLAKYGVFTINDNVITAINEIETEEIFNGSDNETIYFNLQGVKVDKPAKGIYIIVKDGKSQKVIF